MTSTSISTGVGTGGIEDGIEAVAGARSTRRRFALGLIPAALAIMAATTAGPSEAAAASDRNDRGAGGKGKGKGKERRRKRKTRRPRRPNQGPVVTPPPAPAPAPAPAQPALGVQYELGASGTLTVTGSGFAPGQPVTLTIRLDWVPSLNAYLVDFTVPVAADAAGAFAWTGSGYCPHEIVVLADQGAIHISRRVEDYTCRWS